MIFALVSYPFENRVLRLARRIPRLAQQPDGAFDLWFSGLDSWCTPNVFRVRWRRDIRRSLATHPKASIAGSSDYLEHTRRTCRTHPVYGTVIDLIYSIIRP